MSAPEYRPKPETKIALDVKPGHHPRNAASPDSAWEAVEEILAGHRVSADLVGLVSQLDDEHRALMRARLAAVAQVTTGDTLLDVGEVVAARRGDIVAAALGAAHQPTPARLMRTLAGFDASDLDQTDAATIARIVKKFRGESLLSVLPLLGRQVFCLEQHVDLLRWLIESTPAGVVAAVMGTSGSQGLGPLLDQHHLWKPWIDHVHVALPNYAYLASGSSDPDVKRRLLAPFGSRVTQTRDGDSDVEPPSPDAASGLDTAVVTTASRARLLEAIGAAGDIPATQSAETIMALRRVGATADDVLAVTAVAEQPGLAWLQLLLDSPGVGAQHVMAFVAQNPIDVSVLTEPAVRALRARAGKALRLYQLTPLHDAMEHRAIVGSETLREWFLEDARPADLLWFCAFEGDLVSKATRVVVARHPDWSWVRKLTGAEDSAQLRALALSCHEPTTSRYIRDELLHDPKGIASFDGEKDISPKSFGGENDRLRFAIALGDANAVLARLADLDDGERRALGKDAAAVADLAAHANLDEFQFARAAHLMDLDFSQSVAHCSAGAAILVHLRSRPQVEELAALVSPQLVTRAATTILRDILAVFPSLGDRGVLARVLADNPGVLRLLLVGSAPRRVLDLIDVEPAATPALEIFASDAALIRLLPAREHMAGAARAFVDRLARTPELDDDAAAVVGRVTTDATFEERMAGAGGAKDREESTAVNRAAAFHDLEGTDSLADAIDQLGEGDLKKDPAAVFGVLESHKAQVPALLSDGGQWPRVAKLARWLRVPPALACPFISVELLLQMPNALRWYFELADGTVLLHLAVRPGVAGVIGQHLGADLFGARAWLAALPRGAALTDEERHAIDQLERATQVGAVLRTLFEVRFDVPPPASYHAGDLDSLYRVATRLPPSHLDQKRIAQISAAHVDLPGADGTWDGREAVRTITIGPDEHEGKSSSVFHDDALDESAAHGWLTADEVKRTFGYDDAAIAAHVEATDLIARDVGGVTLYKMKPVEIDSFTQVVLHEIGHSVDDILGNHTAPVYQFAGWHEFNDNQFDAWAGEMGGWDKVSGPDRAAIREAWIDAARVSRGVHDLVSGDHPAMAERYADVGIVKAGRDRATFSSWQRNIINGRMFVAGSYPGQWYSLNAAAAASAPSDYSLHAPREYFAESYVEYYRQVDGSPGSEKRKGGGLALAVKAFFDERVDKLKYDPRRFESKDDQPERA